MCAPPGDPPETVFQEDFVYADMVYPFGKRHYWTKVEMITNTRVLGLGVVYAESLSFSPDFYVSEGGGRQGREGDGRSCCSHKNYRIIKILLTLICVMLYNCFVDNYYPGELYKNQFEGGLR